MLGAKLYGYSLKNSDKKIQFFNILNVQKKLMNTKLEILEIMKH